MAKVKCDRISCKNNREGNCQKDSIYLIDRSYRDPKKDYRKERLECKDKECVRDSIAKQENEILDNKLKEMKERIDHTRHALKNSSRYEEEEVAKLHNRIQYLQSEIIGYLRRS